MSGNSSWSRRQTAPIVRRRVDGVSGRSRLIAPGTSAGTCRSAPRRRRSSSLARSARRLTNVPFRQPQVLDREAVPPRRRAPRAAARPSRRRGRCRTRASGRSSSRAPSSAKVSPARPPPERTTSAGPRRRARRASARRSLATSSARDDQGRVVRSSSGDEQRAAARAVVRGLRVLEAALGAVDVALICVQSGRAALPARISVEPVEVDLRRARPPPLLLEPRDELRAQDVDLAVQHPAAVRDVVLLRLELAIRFFELGVGEVARSGSASTAVPSRRDGAAALH